ncbi:MAG: hypothetical protein BroJett011_61570 [Chloroflexota bacterium]|nr:MAG: hypothetical protein BroJett011_61570 [Chloroflexota bacterium]
MVEVGVAVGGKEVEVGVGVAVGGSGVGVAVVTTVGKDWVGVGSRVAVGGPTTRLAVGVGELTSVGIVGVEPDTVGVGLGRVRIKRVGVGPASVAGAEVKVAKPKQ